MKTLDLNKQFDGARLVVFGGTGFLGKVWLSLLLHRFSDIGHVYLVVREKPGLDPEARFWGQVASSPVFDPIREAHPGLAFEEFLRAKVTPIGGDVSEPFGGLAAQVRSELRGQVTALVNVAGVVDFNPPLDDALKVNAFGMQNLVALCRDLDPEGTGVPFMHTSTCYTAGDRVGNIEEIDPLQFPFPKADVPAARWNKTADESVDRLDPVHWDPEREIAECVDVVETVRHRAEDAFRQSHFLDKAKANLTHNGEPTRGSALADELAKVRRKYVEKQLVDAGVERAHYWGWHNIYTYTKSIGEQILAGSGVPYTIGRPAVIESSIVFPFAGWAEGINTSAPLIYLALQGPMAYPAEDDSVLDVIPVDMVSAGMLVSLGELLEGTHKPVYQYGSSDSNPLYMWRLIELVGLYKRKHFQGKGGNPLVNWLMAHDEPIRISASVWTDRGPHLMKRTAGRAAQVLDAIGIGPMKALTGPASKAMKGAEKGFGQAIGLLEMFMPFTATHIYRFSCANTRAGYARLPAEQRAVLPWYPEQINWREYIIDVHCTALEDYVWPEIEEKIHREIKPLRRHDTLVDMLEDLAERHDLATALMRTEEIGMSRVTFRDLLDRACATAARLVALGVQEGERVVLAGANHPDWPIAYFGILRAGAICVPLDPALDESQVRNIVATAGASKAILDADANEAFGQALAGPILDLHEVTEPGPTSDVPDLGLGPDSVASILFTSGTTGVPKGVMLTHGNFTSLLGSLSRLFPLRPSDRVLSVLPLHHTFEFSCGLLLPLSRGARVIYLDELSGERLSNGLKEGRVTAMVGVPAVWQLLERRIRTQVKDKGRLFEVGVDAGLELNRALGKATGLDVGKVFFGSVHDRLGGNIRLLISGGAALPKETQELFQGLGLHLAEGYGLTEAAPVLTVSKGKPGMKLGTVGKAVPGVKLKILNPDDQGVGEVLARGDNVMKGYFGNDAATHAVLDEDGWLHTGDLGRLDHKDRLIIVGRAKDVVVTASGENIYLDDVEAALGTIKYVKELSLVGIPAPRGGERLAMLAVPEPEEGWTRAQAHEEANDAIREAVSRLPAVQRPAVIHLVDADLPRTATRKVKRNEVKDVLNKIVAAAPSGPSGKTVGGDVMRAIAAVAGIDEGKVIPNATLADDLGFDSLMLVELASALNGVGRVTPDADQLGTCRTVADVEAMVQASVSAVQEAPKGDEEDERMPLPPFVAGPAKAALGFLQRGLYNNVLDMKVIGRSFIPQNRAAIVVSNHSSHLDMGLVKLALGPYGRKIVALAAQDYFFEGNPFLVTYFEQLTNLRPIDRKSGLRKSLSQAKDVIAEGHVVLLFPEGTRYTDGAIHEFKPLVGMIALETGLDILPLYLDGPQKIFPKGSVVPRGRTLRVHIGPPLRGDDMARLTAGMKFSDASRKVARLAQTAVESLREGKVLDASRLGVEEEVVAEPTVDERLETMFRGLEERLVPDRVDKPTSWYFSLGGDDGPRWTVMVDKDGCKVRPGRPPTGKADCVVKTSREMITRIVQEAYVPEPPEFISGEIKTSDIPLLIEFSKVFNLSEVMA